MTDQNTKINPVEKIIHGLFNIQNSEIIQKSNALMDRLDETYHIEKITLESLLQELSPKIDQEIIKTAKQGNLTPVAGDLKISVKDDKHLSIFWEFYYTDSNNKYHKTQSEKVIDNSFLTDDSITRIKTQPLAFPINPPSIKG